MQVDIAGVAELDVTGTCWLRCKPWNCALSYVECGVATNGLAGRQSGHLAGPLIRAHSFLIFGFSFLGSCLQGLADQETKAETQQPEQTIAAEPSKKAAEKASEKAAMQRRQSRPIPAWCDPV